MSVSGNRMAKSKRLIGVRADTKTVARWRRRAGRAGMSFNRWACLVLDNAPDVEPARLPNLNALASSRRGLP
jgi:hypothetical protein